MATGATLEALVLGLRGEMLQSVNALHGVNSDPAYKRILARAQRQLWLDFAWPHLRVDRDVALAAGQRYYDFPADLALDRVEKVAAKWSGKWHPLCRGIGSDQYNQYDSDEDVRVDPAWNWNPYGTSQFEIWPMPASDNLQTVRFRGIRALGPLVTDSDTADLDEDLLVLYAASELLADAKNDRASGVERRFGLHYAKLKNRAENNDNGVFRLGGMPQPKAFNRPTPLVAVDRGN